MLRLYNLAFLSLLPHGIGPIVLAHEGKWEQEVGFTPVNVGEKQKVEFALYKQGEPYRQLHRWVNVTE